MKNQFLVKNVNDDIFIDNEFIGHLTNSVGFYGDSTGYFLTCKTSSPLSEWAEQHNAVLYWADTLKPVPLYF